MTAIELTYLVTRVDPGLFHRLETEAANSGQSIQQLVERALRMLFDVYDEYGRIWAEDRDIREHPDA